MKKQILNSKAGYNLVASVYNKKEKYFDSFEKGRVLPLLGNVENKKILDVGTGTGRLAVRLAKAGADIVALDISEGMAEKLKAISYKLKAVVGDAEDLPFKNESFDIVIATFLIVHLKNPRRFFEETYRVLKQGGLFLVTNINQRKAPAIKTKDGLIEIESYYHRPEKIRQALEELAFGIEKEEFVKEGGVWVNQIILARI